MNSADGECQLGMEMITQCARNSRQHLPAAHLVHGGMLCSYVLHHRLGIVLLHSGSCRLAIHGCVPQTPHSKALVSWFLQCVCSSISPHAMALAINGIATSNNGMVGPRTLGPDREHSNFIASQPTSSLVRSQLLTLSNAHTIKKEQGLLQLR